MKCSQNNKPKQGKTYREMGKEHKLANYHKIQMTSTIQRNAQPEKERYNLTQ